MNGTAELLAQKLDALEKEQDPELVYQALENIQAFDRDILTWDATARRQAVSHWLRFLITLDRMIDPKWDAAAKPVEGTVPPSMQGIAYTSGQVDPETIPDPDQRARYVQALKASKDYARWYDLQYQLRHIEKRAMLFVEQILAERFPKSRSGRQELEELLAASPATAARKEWLRSLLPEENG